MSANESTHLPMSDSHVVVTGSSSGIGKATAIEMAKQGARKVLIHYRSNIRGAEGTAKEIEGFGASATLCQADLSVSEDRERLVEVAFREMGNIDAWVNNAGVDVLTGEIASLDFEKKLEKLLTVDLVGTISLSRMVVARWRLLGNKPVPPSMTFTGWDQAMKGMEGDAGQMFGPVKAAVMAYASNLAQSVAPNIRVNTVAPGWIKTAWGSETTEYWSERAKSQALMNRWGKPNDVARAVVFLSQKDNQFFTGQTLEVNGGWNRRYHQG